MKTRRSKRRHVPDETPSKKHKKANKRWQCQGYHERKTMVLYGIDCDQCHQWFCWRCAGPGSSPTEFLEDLESHQGGMWLCSTCKEKHVPDSDSKINGSSTTYLPTLRSYLPSHIHTHVPTYVPTYLRTYLSSHLTT